jgi:hypothetical protein
VVEPAALRPVEARGLDPRHPRPLERHGLAEDAHPGRQLGRVDRDDRLRAGIAAVDEPLSTRAT